MKEHQQQERRRRPQGAGGRQGTAHGGGGGVGGVMPEPMMGGAGVLQGVLLMLADRSSGVNKQGRQGELLRGSWRKQWRK